MKKCSLSLAIREIQIKITVRYYVTLVRMPVIRRPKITNTGKDMKKTEPF
jgi:hypothetical protein